MVGKSNYAVRFDRERKAASEIKGRFAYLGKRCDGLFGCGVVQGIRVADDFSISVEVRRNAGSFDVLLLPLDDVENIYND